MAKVTLKNTKNIIFKAYQEAITQNQRLQLDLDSVNKSLNKSKTDLSSALQRLKAVKNTIRPVVTPKVSTPKVKAEEPQVTPKIADVNDLMSAINALTTIQNNIGTAIAQCANMQVVEAEKLEALQEQITECRTKLKEMYDIDFDDNTLTDLIKSYEETEETFNTSFEEKQKTFKEEVTEKKKNWAKEQSEQARTVADLEEADEKEQEREQEEYCYQLRLERHQEADSYAQKYKQLQDELTEIKETKIEEFTVKENKVKEEEATFKKYKEQYEELPKKLEKAVKQAEHIGVSIIERDAKIKMNLFRREVENEVNANELKAQSLSAIIAKQEAQISRLTVQLENALQQAQNLAIKAIEGTAHAESFSAMKAIAMEQAKNVGKSK